MTLTQSSSLYELVGSNSASPLNVSLATLKSIIHTTIDLLVEEQISATLWVKLPRDLSWQAEIQRYSTQVVPQALYVFHNYPDADEESSGTELAHGDELSTDARTDRPTHYAIELSQNSGLQRDYFLLVMSESFCSVLVTYRPKSDRIFNSNAKPISQGADLETLLPDESTQPKHQHSAFCWFDLPKLQPVLQALKHILPQTQIKVGLNSPITPERVIAEWEQVEANCAAYLPDPELLTRLFTKQIQRQEEIWHRTTNYRKQVEAIDSLQVQNEELVSALRLRDELLSNVAQELRTPLTTMKTALTLLNSPQLKLPQRQRYMQLLRTECDRQGALISSLMDLVQLHLGIDQPTMQPLHLSDLVPGVVSTYQPLAHEKGVMLAYTVPENLPPVFCLSAWLKQVVINLLHNSVKFTPRTGKVWVLAEQQGDYVKLEFRDTGIGIAPSEIPKIFDRFYRGRHTGEDLAGAGLGLTIVQQILLRCGGSVSVKSKMGEGTTFKVLLPIYKAPVDSHD